MVHEAPKEAASVGVGGYWSGANLYVHAPRYCVGGTLGYLGVSDTPSRGYWSGTMQDRGYGLPRILLPRRWVNKGKQNSWEFFSGAPILLGRFTTG
jgi:hypothetical protein